MQIPSFATHTGHVGCWALVALAACGDPDPPAPLRMDVLSSRPDSVTGGDALIEIRFPADVDASAIVVSIDGRDVTAAFGASDGARRIGLVDGLGLGDVTIEAAIPGTTPATLELTNYPITGPVISGPHQPAFSCRTQDAGLGAPLDADCSVETRYEYLYKTGAGPFVPLPDPSQVPADAAKVMRADGVMIDYVVRVERGTINRAIYQITTLYDATQPEWTALAPPPQWTGKLIYSFKGGCGVGHHQGVLQATDDLLAGVFPLADAPVSAGFAIASASLNTLGTSCNDVLAAETAMMVKERFIERYGVPRYTMGWGGSGGSIQQHLIAENYPGLLDGIVPSLSYPDVFTIYPDVMDCPLLVDYFANRSAGRFADPIDQADVSGYATFGTCAGWNGLLGHLEDPKTGCDPSVPAAAIYDPVANPTGVRCTFVDNVVNLIGTDPATGFAHRIYDNVGVQYGLTALNAGAITKEQFLHVNENIGGYGRDGVFQAARTAADLDGLRAAYTGGRVIRGDRGLASTPIVDLRYDNDAAGDIHDRVRSFTTRARLQRANGHTENHAMIVTALDVGAYSQGSFGAIIVADQWLTALVDDTNPDRVAAVRATRPAQITDFCLMPGQDPRPELCLDELPVHRTPRLIAGTTAEADVLKCQLKPLAASDYTVTFTQPEWDRLQAAFPGGVCDYAQPGVEQVAPTATWQSFGPRP